MLTTLSSLSPPLAASALIGKTEWVMWGIMALLLALGLLVTRQLSVSQPGKLQSTFELFMENMCSLIREIVRSDPGPYVPLVGTLFVFVFVANLAGMVPGLSSPTGNLAVTAALATVVFLSVPFYGIRSKGVGHYLKAYIQPNPFLLPLNILSELTRTLSLAIRLFGNIMSGEFLFLVVVGVVTTLLKGYAAVLLPFTLPVTLFLSVLSLITAAIQAYIFTVLALVYIGAAIEPTDIPKPSENAQTKEGSN